MASFLSTFQNKVDQKGRVSVPAPFRALLAGQSFNGIVVYRTFRNEALDACGMGFMDELVERQDEMKQGSEEYQALSSIFGDSVQLPFDGEGRVVLPKHLMDFANITDSVAFYGIGRSFQLWEPAALEEHKLAMQPAAAALQLNPRKKAAAQ